MAIGTHSGAMEGGLCTAGWNVAKPVGELHLFREVLHGRGAQNQFPWFSHCASASLYLACRKYPIWIKCAVL